MTSEVIYTGNLRTSAKHLKSGMEIITDAPTDNQGQGQAFSPTDLVATALASCMLTTMGIKAGDKGWDLEGSQASVLKVMAANPRRITEVHIVLSMKHSDLGTDERHMLEETARNCPVAKSVHPDMVQQVQFEW